MQRNADTKCINVENNDNHWCYCGISKVAVTNPSTTLQKSTFHLAFMVESCRARLLLTARINDKRYSSKEEPNNWNKHYVLYFILVRATRARNVQRTFNISGIYRRWFLFALGEPLAYFLTISLSAWIMIP